MESRCWSLLTGTRGATPRRSAKFGKSWNSADPLLLGAVVVGNFNAPFNQALVVLFAGVFQDFPICAQRENTGILPRFRIGLGVIHGHFIRDVAGVSAIIALDHVKLITDR